MNARRIGSLAALVAALATVACGDDTGGSGSGGAGGTGAASTSSNGATTTSGDATTTASSTASTSTAGGTGDSSSTAGTGGGDGGAAPTCESGLEQESPACQACQDANCCITATASADDPGTWTNSAAIICREANCFAECDVEQPECGGIVPSPASCADELYANCCAETEACAKDDACVALIYICIDDRGCNPGSKCWDECAEELGLEGGMDEWDAFLTCFNGPWSCG